MTEVRFYQLTRMSMEQALPELLEKTLTRGWRAVVMAGSPERVEALTQLLWTYRPDGFLPHGNAKDGAAAQQPVWLTSDDENPNGATVLFLTDGAASARVGDYEVVCELFEGEDQAPAVVEARRRWIAYREAGHALSYWQQGEKGWTKEA